MDKAVVRTTSKAEEQEIWDELAAEGDPFQLSAAQAAELDRRLADHRANPTEGSSLEEIAAALGVRL